MRPRVEILPRGGARALPAYRVSIRRSLDWPVGEAEIDLPLSNLAPAIGTMVTVRVTDADEDAPFLLFTGEVSRREHNPRGSRIQLRELTSRMAVLRVDREYPATTAGAVIRDLASTAEVPLGEVDPGATLRSFTLLRERTALDHAIRLSRVSGLVLRTQGDGSLHATPPPTDAASSPLDSRMPIAWARQQVRAHVRDVYVTGEGAFNTSGEGAESWLRADPSSLSAGTLGDNASIEHWPVIKTDEDISRLAAAESRRERESSRCIEFEFATPIPVDLGQLVPITAIAGFDGAVRVTGLWITLDAHRGYLCRLRAGAVS